jgi:hypothetical protein
MENEFVDIKGFEGIFEINRKGEINRKPLYIKVNDEYVIYREAKKIKYAIGANGYAVVNLTSNGKVKIALLHRLLGEAFIPNPEKKLEINHIDGNRANFSLDNLEWCTRQENVIHSYKRGLQIAIKGARHPWFGKKGTRTGKLGELAPHAKPIIDQETGVFYFGCREAADAKGFKENSLRHMLNGSRKNKTMLMYV